MLRGFMPDELERIWKGAVISQSRYSLSIFLGGTEETHE
jgi:hypothetical protein